MITDEAVNQLIAQRLNTYYAGKEKEHVITDLRKKYADDVWTEEEFDQQFGVQFFDNPVVHVIRRADGLRGTVAYIADPRVYFSFIPQTSS